ncbi:MAG: hypothetical protein IJM83_09920 [Firmicutes bacterium]|nr:hypothetical protein [Bacillota bacterium]
MKELLIRLFHVLTDRIMWISLILVALFTGILISLYQIQVKDRDHYVELASEQKKEAQSYQITKTIPRGNIYDRNGNPLALNVEHDSLFYIPAAENENLAASLTELMDLFSRYQMDFSIDQVFPLLYSEKDGFSYHPAFDERYNEINHWNFLAEVYNTSRDELTEEQRRTNAKDAFMHLYEETFGFTPTEDMELAVRLCSVYYAVFSGRFDPEIPIRLAVDIPEEMMVRILERPDLYKGFFAQKEYERIYPEGYLFAHIVGYVGRISQEEMEEYADMGLDYPPNAVVGKNGIEQAYEQTLAGGNDVYLTIERDFQEQTYLALEKQIRQLLLTKIESESKEPFESYTLRDVFASMIGNRIFTDKMLSSGEPWMTSYRETADDAAQTFAEELTDAIMENLPVKSYSDTLKAIYDLMITNMRDEGRLSYQYQKDDAFYVPYAEGEKGAYDLFSHALDHQYIPLDEFGLNSDIPKETLIEKIVEFEIKELSASETYRLLVCQRMIQDGWFFENEMILLLYEQKILDDTDGLLIKLQNEEITAKELILSKIREGQLTPQQIALDPCSGSVVVSDPFSGEILSIVSYPSYDPMRFMNDDDYYNQIVLDVTGPLSFRAVFESRAIGSTYKTCTAITALELGVIDEKTKIHDDYTFPYVNSADHPACWSSVSHGDITVAQALDHSCNYFFYQLGYLLSEPDQNHQFDDDVGLKKMANYAKILGLATPTQIEIGETVPTTSSIDAVRSSIGQGTNAFSAANINRYTCTLTNGGTVYNLYLVDEVKSPNGKTLYRAQGEIDHETGISDNTLRIVKAGMRLVVTDEHKEEFQVLEKLNIHAAGKTGTVQEAEDRPDHSLFTGYTTIEDPKIVVTAMIPFGGGSHNAIPVFVDVVQSYYGIFLDTP